VFHYMLIELALGPFFCCRGWKLSLYGDIRQIVKFTDVHCWCSCLWTFNAL